MARHDRRFRFAVQVGHTATGQEWADLAREVESLGYATLTMPDHFGDQFAVGPALAAAAAATTTLRIGTLVYDNDYRHPVVLAKEAATLDVLASERLIENAARTGERLLGGLAAMIPRSEFLRDVRGKGLMIGIELGPPRSLKLKASWHALEGARPGLFSQLITIPLFKDHKI